MITFKPAGFTVTDVYRDGDFVGMLKKHGKIWRYHAKGDAVGIEMSASATSARNGAAKIVAKELA